MGQPSCNICGSDESKVCITGQGIWHCFEPDLGPPFPYQVAVCKKCGHVYGSWDRDRSVQYVDEEYATCDTSLPVYNSFVTFCLSGLPRYRHRSARVLEIGFNRGSLLRHFYDFGFECHGIEPGRKNVEFACRRMPRANLETGLFTAEWARQFEPGYFDLVIMTSVFEHLPQPMEALQAIQPIVSPAGRLFLVVPDLSLYTPTYQVKRDDRNRYGCSPLVFFYRNFFLCYAQHVSHFSPASLRRYLQVAGFQVSQMANVAGLWFLAAPSTPAPSHMNHPDLVRYHLELMDYYQRLLNDMRAAMVAKLSGKQLVCYGAGRDFGYFLEVFREHGIEPLAVADDNPRIETRHGVRVVSPDQLATFKPDLCLATSFNFDHEITERARNILPSSTEVMTLTDLIYELDVEPPVTTDFDLKPRVLEEVQMASRRAGSQ